MLLMLRVTLLQRSQVLTEALIFVHDKTRYLTSREFYCYAHMTLSDLRTLDTPKGPDYIDGYLPDEGPSRNPNLSSISH